MASNARATICLFCLLGLAAGNFISPGLNKCLDIHAKKKDDDTRQTIDDMKAETEPINVQLYKCHEKLNQDWEITEGKIKSTALGKCLTAESKKPNANVFLDECGDDLDTQTWDLTGYSYVKLAGTENCLDIQAKLKANKKRENWAEIKAHKTANAQLFTCHDPLETKRVNQLWEWAPVTGNNVGVERLWEQRMGAREPHTAAGWGPAAAGVVGLGALFGAAFVALRTRRSRTSIQEPLADVE